MVSRRVTRQWRVSWANAGLSSVPSLTRTGPELSGGRGRRRSAGAGKPVPETGRVPGGCNAGGSRAKDLANRERRRHMAIRMVQESDIEVERVHCRRAALVAGLRELSPFLAAPTDSPMPSCSDFTHWGLSYED